MSLLVLIAICLDVLRQLQANWNYFVRVAAAADVDRYPTTIQFLEIRLRETSLKSLLILPQNLKSDYAVS